jgi:hypothetical protein
LQSCNLQQICEIDEFVWWQSLFQELKEPKRSLALAFMCMLSFIIQLDAYCKSRWLQGMSLHIDYDRALLPVQVCVCVLSTSNLLPAIVELELVCVLCWNLDLASGLHCWEKQIYAWTDLSSLDWSLSQ